MAINLYDVHDQHRREAANASYVAARGRFVDPEVIGPLEKHNAAMARQLARIKADPESSPVSREGARAAEAGKPATECEYAAGTHAHRLWMIGYDHATERRMIAMRSKSRKQVHGMFIGKVCGRITRDHFGHRVSSYGGVQTRKHRKEIKMLFKTGQLPAEIPF